ncbi:hypothetical protein F5Y05DRAFT_323011 [Hypoxylon sp. FL0543]|nr:hypothetical protein F5Y05DRAFT_323011 [Hypoxylon sp. FL0543]
MPRESVVEIPEMRLTEDIIKMYDEGVVFFNKTLLRRLADELGMHKQGLLKDNKITLKNLKGEDVEFILDANEPTVFEDLRCNHGDRRLGPYIYYRNFQKMISRNDMKDFDVRRALLPFVVMYPDPEEASHDFVTPRGFLYHYMPEELSVIFDLEKQKWEDCEPYHNIKKTFESQRKALRNATQIVGFGCGTLSNGRIQEDYSLTQHAMILSLQKVLTKMKPENKGVRASIRKLLSNGGEFDAMDNVVRCVVQDPAYTDLDKEVLKGKGFAIEDDPRGFLAVDEKTVVVSISANAPVQQIICDVARPVAIIQMKVREGWNDESGQHCADPASPRVTKMLRDEYERVPLDYHPRIRRVEMYVRKST